MTDCCLTIMGWSSGHENHKELDLMAIIVRLTGMGRLSKHNRHKNLKSLKFISWLEDVLFFGEIDEGLWH